MGLLDTNDVDIFVRVAGSTNAKESLSGFETALVRLTQDAQLSGDKNAEYELACKGFITKSLIDAINPRAAHLNEGQFDMVVRSIEDLYALNLTDTNSVRDGCQHKFRKEIRELATYINSCRANRD